MPKTNLLFVCSRNKRRSLTAEMIFRNHEDFDVKSCGTSPQSRIKINEKLGTKKSSRSSLETEFKEKPLKPYSSPMNLN
ncbi:MAG: hypothetical protein MUF45_14340 [Spirosomaceae bacterium]|nr:hypothetical protein [Spirosomataceae bacterium]